MSAIAVVVGVDAYADQPLTSAVHDALAFRDELVSLGLVQPTDVRLLTAPVVGGSTLADTLRFTSHFLLRAYVAVIFGWSAVVLARHHDALHLV